MKRTKFEKGDLVCTDDIFFQLGIVDDVAEFGIFILQNKKRDSFQFIGIKHPSFDTITLISKGEFK